MLIALGCVTLIALAVIAFAYAQQKAHQESQAQWVLERRELLERIQRPERPPVLAEREPFELPDVERDATAHRIGEVVSIANDYGLGEDG